MNLWAIDEPRAFRAVEPVAKRENWHIPIVKAECSSLVKRVKLLSRLLRTGQLKESDI